MGVELQQRRMLVVQKYGGSSVGDLERIRGVAERCARRRSGGDDLVVVVSAMAGQTDHLIAMANELVTTARSESSGEWVSSARGGDDSHERELSQLMSTGEKVSAALLSMALNEAGCPATSLVGHQLGLRTDRQFTNARITGIEQSRVRRELDKGRVVVCAGFQGVDPDGNITTLGRGGSDTSAVAMAVAIGADVCEILTDVDGVYTTDPRVVQDARKIPRICYEEMIELASLGTKVLQIRSVEFAMKYGVAVHVRSSQNTNEGTMIVPEDENMEKVVVRGVALDRSEAKVTVTNCPDIPGTVAKLFGVLGRAGVVVDMIIQNASRSARTDVTFTVPRADLKKSVEQLSLIDFIADDSEVGFFSDPEISKISIVGVGMRSHTGVAARAFEALAEEGINVQMVSTSEIKVSVVVAAKYGELALRALHDAFGLADAPQSAGHG